MEYSVIWSERSSKELEKIETSVRERIVSKVERIKENPFRYVKGLEGVPLFSLRVGDYRVIMDIKKSKLIILVVRIGLRKGVYKKL